MQLHIIYTSNRTGAQEVTNANAMDKDGIIKDARYWYGHATKDNKSHYHNPNMGAGSETPTHKILLGYALDGFPIYGPLDDASGLDPCNGISSEGNYQYHVRDINDVRGGDKSYCDDDDETINNWNYVLGCYHGKTTSSTIGDAAGITNQQKEEILNNCVQVYPGSEENPTTKSPTSTPKTRPNIIVMQPDDIPFYDRWSPPVSFARNICHDHFFKFSL